MQKNVFTNICVNNICDLIGNNCPYNVLLQVLEDVPIWDKINFSLCVHESVKFSQSVAV